VGKAKRALRSTTHGNRAAARAIMSLDSLFFARWAKMV
jgi:hypothetical protein